MQSTLNSGQEPLDIIFISYDETNAGENWEALKSRFPWAKRVHGVKGIKEAHQLAAAKSETPFFYVVDGDNKILPEFSFGIDGKHLEEDSVYVYRCKNPVNGLVYGYGAVKIYNKTLLKRQVDQYVDLATHMSVNYKIINEIASETWFNSTDEEAWRGAFRECAKLASGLIERQNSKETLERLNIWCEKSRDVPFAKDVLMGACEGRDFGMNNREQMYKINDFNWLKERFGEKRK